MTKEEMFNRALSIVQDADDNGELKALIAKGLDVNQKDEFDTSLAARAIYGAINYNALYALWEAKAEATTAYVQEIFSEFDNGKTAAELYAKDSAEVTAEKDKVKLDLTNSFSIDQLRLDYIDYEFTQEIENEQDAEIEVNVVFEPFLYDGNICNPEMQFLGFSSPELEQAVFSSGQNFTEETMEGDSIYLESVHNPVELKWLKIEKNHDYEQIDLELFFDFEYEGDRYKNQSLKLRFKKKV